MARRTLREQHYRELLVERYGPIADLEAERNGPTPARRRRNRLREEAEERLKKGRP